MDIKQINQYEIIHKIGESTLSVIYKGYDSERQLQVSVKKLIPSESIKRDMHKLKCYIGLDNANLAKMISVEEYDGTIIVVSEYVDGTPLQQLLISNEFPKENFLSLIQQISNGLKSLHTQNLPHGNLKLSNIIIQKNGNAVLTDFGLSPFVDFQFSPEFVAPYEAYHFLSPEQVKNETVTYRSDFFTIGTIAYRILFGKLPFEGQNEDELIKSILEHSPDFTQLKSGSVKSIYSLLLGKLLAKEPKERFVDIFELIATLREIELFDKNSSKYVLTEAPISNPRKYLTFSVLAVLLVILWLVASLASH